MNELLGVPSILVTIGITIILMGFGAFMTGQAIANTWRPAWQVVPYSLLLGFLDRFLVWGMFGGVGMSVAGYLIDTAFLLLVTFLAFRMTTARRMVLQYPWLYERTGPFSWREKSPG